MVEVVNFLSFNPSHWSLIPLSKATFYHCIKNIKLGHHHPGQMKNSNYKKSIYHGGFVLALHDLPGFGIWKESFFSELKKIYQNNSVESDSEYLNKVTWKWKFNYQSVTHWIPPEQRCLPSAWSTCGCVPDGQRTAHVSIYFSASFCG